MAAEDGSDQASGDKEGEKLCQFPLIPAVRRGNEGVQKFKSWRDK